MVTLSIFYKQLGYEKIENVPAYSSLDLFGKRGFYLFYLLQSTSVRTSEWFVFAGDLGGQIGLFLGCSMLTLMEFVELGINLIAVTRKHHDSRTFQQDMPDRS